MEKTGWKIICGAPTTLTVKGLMMMMMMMMMMMKALWGCTDRTVSLYLLGVVYFACLSRWSYLSAGEKSIRNTECIFTRLHVVKRKHRDVSELPSRSLALTAKRHRRQLLKDR